VSSPPYRILVVEDNPDTRELLRDQLDRPDLTVVPASNGQEAILLIGEEAPDLVIMDVMMPQLNGFETSRYLKLRYRERFLPILMLSAKSDQISKREGARYGCDDYREKPYTKQQLLTSVDALLSLSLAENALKALTADGQDASPTYAQTRRQIIDARFELAKRLLGEQSPDVARRHAQRVLELAPDHDGCRNLLTQLAAP
jgi:DNA-binding response OmpR family regulator